MNPRSIASPPLFRPRPADDAGKKLGLVLAGLFVFARLGLGGFTLTDTIDLLPGPDTYAPQWEGLNHNTHRLYALGSYAMGFQDYAIQVIDTTTGEVVTGIDLGTKTNNGVVSPVQPFGFAVDEGTTAGGNKAYALIQLGQSQFGVRTISDDGIVPNSDVILPAFTSYDSLAVNSITHRVYAVDEAGEVTVIDGPGHSIVTSLNSFVGNLPHVTIVNPNSNTVLLFGSNGAALINGSSSATPVTLPANFSAKGGAYNSSDNRFYVFAVKGNASGVADYGVFVFDGTGGTLVSSKTGFDSNVATVAIDPATNTVFLGTPNNFTGSITTLNAGDLSTKGSFDIGASALAFDTGSLFLLDSRGGAASQRLRNAVGILNTGTGALVHKTVGYAPNCVAVNKVTNRIYIADEKAAELEVISGADHSVLARVPLEPIDAESYFPENSLPRHIAVSETLNRIYLTRSRPESDGSYTLILDVFDGTNNQLLQSAAVASSTIYAPGPIAVDDAHKRIFVLAFTFQGHPLVELNADTNATINIQALGANMTDVAVNPVTGRVYVSGRDNNGNGIVQIMDGATLNLVTTVAAGALPGPMAVNTKTNKIYVANTGAGSVDNSVTVINGATDSSEGTFKNTSQNNGDAVTNVAVDESTNTIFVADNSNFFDARGRLVMFNGSGTFQKQVDVGRYPVALAFNSATKELFVINNEEGTISVLGTGVAAPPTPPPHGGLSATKFTVNASSSPVYPPSAPPVTNLADTIIVFAAQQTGTPADLAVRVQASTTPGIESSWTNLANASNGGMMYDITTSQFVLSSNDYPTQNGVYFRASASAQSYPDSNSNVVGPFNLASNKSRIASTALHFIGNGPISDLYFKAIESATPPGISVRVQTTTTPADETTWTDLNNGHAGAMTQSNDPSQFLLLADNYPITTGIYFRAVASASGFVDSISNLVGPFDIAQSVPPLVDITPPAGLPNSGNGAGPDSPILVREGTFSVSANAETNRALKKLALQVDGQTKFELSDGSKHLDYTLGGVPLGDHVLEAVAVDDQGARARAGTGAIYIRVVPTPSAHKAMHSEGSSTSSADSTGKVYSVANSGGSWDDSATWVDAAGNPGIPGPDDFVVLGSASVKFGLDRTVKSLSINGGHLLGPGIVTIVGTMTFTAGTVEGDVGIIIDSGAVLQLNNSTDFLFNPGSSGIRGHIYNAGTCNIHGSAGIIGAKDITNHGTINWLPAIGIPLNASIDPNAALRSLQSATFTNGGIISGDLTRLIGSDSLIGHDSSSLIGHDSSSLVAAGGGNIVGSNSAGLIGSDSAGIVGSNSAGVVSAGGGNCIAAGGGNFRALTTARADSTATGFTQSGGEINLNAFNIIGPVTLDGGTLTGSGLIQGDLTNNGGYILPGHSAGVIRVLGNFSQGANGTLVIEDGGPSPLQFEQLQVTGAANLDGKLDMKLINGYTPDPADTFSPLGYSSESGSLSSISSNAQITVTSNGLLATVNPSIPGPSTGQPLNIATRLAIQGGDNVLIAGFIVNGPSGSTKKVVIRGIGPSLANFGVAGTLSDPLLELHNPDGSVVVNDNWQQGDTSQIPSGFAPSDPRESVIVATLTPGNYSAVVKGAHGETGVCLAEVYDFSSDSAAQLANIATRGFVNTGDGALIGGFIVGGSEPAKMLVIAAGPSLAAFGVDGALLDPMLELHDSNGNVISNDDWRNTQEGDITATGLIPSDNRESAILATLVPGNYTAVVRGKDDTTGIAIVQAFNLQ